MFLIQYYWLFWNIFNYKKSEISDNKLLAKMLIVLLLIKLGSCDFGLISLVAIPLFAVKTCFWFFLHFLPQNQINFIEKVVPGILPSFKILFIEIFCQCFPVGGFSLFALFGLGLCPSLSWLWIWLVPHSGLFLEIRLEKEVLVLLLEFVQALPRF